MVPKVGVSHKTSPQGGPLEERGAESEAAVLGIDSFAQTRKMLRPEAARRDSSFGSSSGSTPCRVGYRPLPSLMCTRPTLVSESYEEPLGLLQSPELLRAEEAAQCRTSR